MKQLIELDYVYIRWIELMHRMKKHIWDPDFVTFGAYCDRMRREGFKIV